MDEQKKEELNKKVDETWKESIKKESAGAGADEVPEATFNLFITSLMMQGLIALGDLEHPVTKAKERNLQQAKFIIDTLAMLQEKTRNNLAGDEAATLESVLYELRMRFVGSAERRV